MAKAHQSQQTQLTGDISNKTKRVQNRSTLDRDGDLVCFRPTDANHYAVSRETVFYQAHVQFVPPPLRVIG